MKNNNNNKSLNVKKRRIVDNPGLLHLQPSHPYYHKQYGHLHYCHPVPHPPHTRATTQLSSPCTALLENPPTRLPSSSTSPNPLFHKKLLGNNCTDPARAQLRRLPSSEASLQALSLNDENSPMGIATPLSNLPNSRDAPLATTPQHSASTHPDVAPRQFSNAPKPPSEGWGESQRDPQRSYSPKTIQKTISYRPSQTTSYGAKPSTRQTPGPVYRSAASNTGEASLDSVQDIFRPESVIEVPRSIGRAAGASQSSETTEIPPGNRALKPPSSTHTHSRHPGYSTEENIPSLSSTKQDTCASKKSNGLYLSQSTSSFARRTKLGKPSIRFSTSAYHQELGKTYPISPASNSTSLKTAAFGTKKKAIPRSSDDKLNVQSSSRLAQKSVSDVGDTYKLVSKRQLESSSNGMKDGAGVQYEEEEEDAKDYRQGGYHPVRIGDQFSSAKHRNQYEVIRKLGWGHFSTVWLCWDSINKRHVAMKIVKSAEHYSEAAVDEIKLLERVSKHRHDNLAGHKHVVELYDSFWHTGPHGKHVCMVFEVLGENLLAIIRRHNHHGIPMSQVKTIAKQIFSGLNYLHENCGIIHTDLKPENVLVVVDVEDLLRQEERFRRRGQRHAGDHTDRHHEYHLTSTSLSQRSRSSSRRGLRGPVLPTEPLSLPATNEKILHVKLADLGNACWIDHHFTNDIQTRQYRAPEIILGSRWGPSVDIWSAACLIFELATGDYLFDPREGRRYGKNDDHMALIMELHGHFPRHLALSGDLSRSLFNKRGELIRIRSLNYQPLNEVLTDHYLWDSERAGKFAEFLMPCLCLNSNSRAKARHMVDHTFLSGIE